MIKLVYFIFEEPAYLPAGQVHLVLVLDLLLFDAIQELDEVKYSIGEEHPQGLSLAEEDILFDEMALSQRPQEGKCF